VISRPRGSVPEFLRHGEHGFLVESEDELIDACRNLDTIDRRACRDWALQRFSVERMTIDYLRVYRKIIDGAREPAA
jgi:glycosyltransferase involved in cell wall biosynthesis